MKTSIDQKEARYLDNLLEWSILVNGEQETLNIINSENGVIELMDSYNKAYKDFFQKFMDQFNDTREAFSHAIMIKVYYGIKKNGIVKEENESIRSFINSLDQS